jgi:hypothetical protein
VLLLVAGDQNKGQATKIWPGSRARRDLGATAYPFFLHSVYAGLVPPFSDFFYTILSHYRIHALHLQPNSILLLAMFAFYCEAFVGVMTSVALFRHFFCLRLTATDQRSRCASFLAVKGMENGIINLRVAKKVKGCRQRRGSTPRGEEEEVVHQRRVSPPDSPGASCPCSLS